MTVPTITLRDVGKRYENGERNAGLWAVRGVTFPVYRGEMTVLMGPSGSGKTTLLSLMGGLLSPTEGGVTVCGQALEGLGEPARQWFRRRNVGFVFQSSNLLSALTVERNVRVALRLRGAAEDGAGELLRLVGLEEKASAFPEQLSGGQRQRVSVARALAGAPPVLLADEPTAALDAAHGRRVIRLLRRCARERDATVVIVTHDPRVREFADRVIELEDGRLQRIVRRAPARSVVAEVERLLSRKDAVGAGTLGKVSAPAMGSSHGFPNLLPGADESHAGLNLPVHSPALRAIQPGR